MAERVPEWVTSAMSILSGETGTFKGPVAEKSFPCSRRSKDLKEVWSMMKLGLEGAKGPGAEQGRVWFSVSSIGICLKPENEVTLGSSQNASGRGYPHWDTGWGLHTVFFKGKTMHDPTSQPLSTVPIQGF